MRFIRGRWWQHTSCWCFKFRDVHTHWRFLHWEQFCFGSTSNLDLNRTLGSIPTLCTVFIYHRFAVPFLKLSEFRISLFGFTSDTYLVRKLSDFLLEAFIHQCQPCRIGSPIQRIELLRDCFLLVLVVASLLCKFSNLILYVLLTSVWWLFWVNLENE